LLAGRGDVRGLDRRSEARHPGSHAGSSTARALGSAQHVPLDVVFGLRTRQGWALVRGVCMSASGLVVQLFDLLDPTLDPPRRRIARRTFAQLAARLGAPGARTRSPGRGSSPLAAVGGCVLAGRVVADLSVWSNGRPARPSSRAAPRPVSATLVVPVARRHAAPAACNRGGGPVVQIPAELAPLNDPRPDVLGIALTEAAVARFAMAVRSPVPNR
jgi:hypothetical protein